MQSAPKVLIIEDEKMLQDLFRSQLANYIVNVLQAFTIQQALTMFSEHHKSLSLIAVDACVPGREPTTPELIPRFREVFRGHIIAMSSQPEHVQALLAAGCNEKCNKVNLTRTISNLLALQRVDGAAQ